MTDQEALNKAWADHYGNIDKSLLPPIHSFFREAFYAGIEHAENKEPKTPLRSV